MSDERDLPSGWVLVRIKDITLCGGTRTPQGEGVFQYVDIDALDNKRQMITTPKLLANSSSPSRARMVIRFGDVIFSLVRPYLKNIAVVPYELDNQIASTAYCVIHPIEGANSFYLYYFLLQDSFIHSIPTYGNSPPAARDEEFLSMTIPLPPINEQNRIVETIDQQFTRLDAGIASLKQAQARLKRYRAAVLKAAVEGKLTEEWRAEHPDTESAELLLQRILTERRTRWEEEQRAKGKDPDKLKYEEPARPDTENLPELPEGWIWATVEQVGDVQGGIQKQPKRKPHNNAYPYLRVANVMRDRLDLTEIEMMELFGNELETLRLIKGDILIVEGNGSRNEIGRCAVWNAEIKDCVHQNHIIRVRLNHILPSYYNYYWNSPDGMKRVVSISGSTSGLYTLSTSKVSRMILPLPSLAEQEQIVAEVESRLSIVGEVESEIDANLKRAERLRQSILREAFGGRLVPQDPNDEPASVLLERIKAGKSNKRGGFQENNETMAMNNNHRKIQPVEPVPNDEQQLTLLAE